MIFHLFIDIEMPFRSSNWISVDFSWMDEDGSLTSSILPHKYGHTFSVMYTLIELQVNKSEREREKRKENFTYTRAQT